MDRASDVERLYQCLTCKYTEGCTLDESAEDDRGLCEEYIIDEVIAKKLANCGCKSCIHT